MITILILISRPQFLDRIFATLELLDCNPKDTGLLAIVDGNTNLFVTARNKVSASKFASRLCLEYTDKGRVLNSNIQYRRQRIADIHNYAKQHISKDTYVWGIEDDTLFATDTLTKLQRGYNIYPFAGFIQGYQVGRHGIYHYGVWKVNDIYEPTNITSQLKPDYIKLQGPNISHLVECDAGGMYCFLTKSNTYLKHEFKPFNNNDLGPDFDYGLALRQQGLMNYTDFTIPCDHMTDKGIIAANSEVEQVQFIKVGDRFRQKSL